METNRELLNSRQVVEFLTVANEYCLLIEECSKHPRENIQAYLQRILPLLFLKGSLLPDITPADPEQNERYVTEEQYEIIFNELRAVFESTDKYWKMGHISEEVPQPLRGSIAEDLADIYQEMKDFVLLYQKPLTAASENAVASCRYYFLEHWGKKVLQATGAIHNILNPCCEDHHHE